MEVIGGDLRFSPLPTRLSETSLPSAIEPPAASYRKNPHPCQKAIELPTKTPQRTRSVPCRIKHPQKDAEQTAGRTPRLSFVWLTSLRSAGVSRRTHRGGLHCKVTHNIAGRNRNGRNGRTDGSSVLYKSSLAGF